MYFNKWIELFDHELKEHDHYEFAFTSGSLLHHITYGDPATGDKIEALKINRNAIILMDRDRVDKSAKLKTWVSRVETEIASNEGLAWVTEAREVENYIPIETLRTFLGDPNFPAPGNHEDIISLIKTHGKGDFEPQEA